MSMNEAAVLSNGRKRISQKQMVWRNFVHHRMAILGGVIVSIFVLCAIFAPWVAPHDPFKISLQRVLQPPSFEHPLGTDQLGRDMLSRIIYGARVSLTIGLVAVAIGVLGGVPAGAIAGFYGGKADLIFQRAMDVLLALPGILLALVVIAVLGVGLFNTMIAIGIASIPVYARLVRGLVLSIKEQEYISAARALGIGNLRTVFRHIMPNCLGPIIVVSSLEMATAILAAAGLGFLGLGAQPPTPEWGTMLSDGRLFLRTAHHLVTFPGLAIVLAVLGFNLLGDGLRDALDPKLKTTR